MSSFTALVPFGYGAYNLTGNNKAETGGVTSAVGYLMYVNPVGGLIAGGLIAKFGEEKLTQRSIDLGKQYIKQKEK